MAETRFPLVFETHEYRPGSAGDGQYRGGYGGDMRLRVETEGLAMANTAGEGMVHGARGMLGGARRRAARLHAAGARRGRRES